MNNSNIGSLMSSYRLGLILCFPVGALMFKWSMHKVARSSPSMKKSQHLSSVLILSELEQYIFVCIFCVDDCSCQALV